MYDHGTMQHASRNLTVERLRALPVHRDDEVWEIAIVRLPTPVQEPGDKEPWRPVCAVCASNRGGAMVSQPVRPSELAASAALDALASFAQDSHVHHAPPLGFLPSRIHVAELPPPVHAHLAAALAELGIEIEERAQLPEVQAFVGGMVEAIRKIDEVGELDAPPLLRKGITVERIHAFAEAAALFSTAAPWKHFDHEVVWTITPQPKTRPLRHCLVMGGGGEEFGLAFLPSALEIFHMEQRAIFGEPVRPRGTLWSVTFDHFAQAPLKDQELWERERLPLASPGAFPIPVGFTESGRAVRPRADQLALMEMLLRAFASLTAADAREDLLTFLTHNFDGDATLILERAAEIE